MGNAVRDSSRGVRGANRQCIADYYLAIDQQRIDWVLSLFAPDAVYERADARYDGRAAITDFFSNRRRIRGTHHIETLWATEQDDAVFVTGRFEGVGEEGDARSIGFADVWTFGTSGQVVRRQTFLATGHGYVER